MCVVNFSWSRTSPITDFIPRESRSKWFGSVGGGRAYPLTSAQRRMSQAQSHDPLKPV